MSQKRLFSQVVGSSLSQMAKSSRGLRKGKTTLTRAARKPRTTVSAGVKRKTPVTRTEVAKIARAVVQNSAELKYHYDYSAGQNVGQVNGNATGHNSITFAYPAKGTASNQRIGDKIRLRGLSCNALFSGMSSQSAAARMQCYLVWFKGADVTIDIGTFLDPNQQILGDHAVSIYDSLSFRDTQIAGAVKVLASWELYLKEESSVQGNGGNQLSHGTYQQYIPLNIQQSFDEAGDPASGELVLYTVCDVGNRSASTVSTLTGVPVTPINTGYSFQFTSKLEYTDV